MRNKKENIRSNVEIKQQSYTCPKCNTNHLFYELKANDNGWDYTYACKNCGDIMESNGENYWATNKIKGGGE